MSVANIKHTRKSGTTEEKDKKRQSDSPAKEMMKKLAAKEKDKKERDTPKEKNTDRDDKNVDKQEKNTEKQDKNTEKQDKKQEKAAEKRDEKQREDKGEKSGKTDRADKRSEQKPKHNGNPTKPVQNGVGEVTAPASVPVTVPVPMTVTVNANGGLGAGDEAPNGTVSQDSDDDENMLVIDDQEQDDMFPELTYDEASDNESFEPPTPENAPSRSLTRRSQVKVTRTPETPRPQTQAADPHPTEDNSKEPKVSKGKDDTPVSDRKLRSADSPKPESKKTQEDRKDKSENDDDKHQTDKSDNAKDKTEVSVTKVDIAGESTDKTGDDNKKGNKIDDNDDVIIDITGDDIEQEKERAREKSDTVEVEIVVEVEGTEEPRKADTNYSKSRVKVSPYRRSMRLAEHADVSASASASASAAANASASGSGNANVSLLANYTGNNTTMEMDITESSFVSEEIVNHDSSGYLQGLRTIRGRTSYKPLKQMTYRNITNRVNRPVSTAVLVEGQPRPTGTVVGRKRKPDAGRGEGEDAWPGRGGPKRMRLLDRIAMPFRRAKASHSHSPTPLPLPLPLPLPPHSLNRRAAEIVGINTDLPLSSPVISEDGYDPESMKATNQSPATVAVASADEPVAVPLPPPKERDSKRCIVV